MKKGFHIIKIGEKGCGKTAAANNGNLIATVEDQIRYYKKEFDAVIAEANRQCTIAADLALKIIDLEEKVCQMKK